MTYSLAPALPPIPSIEPGIPGKPPEAEVLGFEVGDARLSLRVVLEADGTQIDLHHVGGAPIALWVQMPTPPGVSIGALYVDWAEVENRAFPPRVELSAENPEATLWGRFIPHRAAWPTTIPDQISAQLERGGLHLILPNEEYIFDPHRLFGESLAELLGVPLVVSDRPPAPTDGIAPLVISFVGEYDAPTGKAADDAKLAALITATERFVLNQHH